MYNISTEWKTEFSVSLRKIMDWNQRWKTQSFYNLYIFLEEGKKERIIIRLLLLYYSINSNFQVVRLSDKIEIEITPSGTKTIDWNNRLEFKKRRINF